MRSSFISFAMTFLIRIRYLYGHSRQRSEGKSYLALALSSMRIANLKEIFRSVDSVLNLSMHVDLVSYCDNLSTIIMI